MSSEHFREKQEKEIVPGKPIAYRQNDSGDMGYLVFNPDALSANSLDEIEERDRVIDLDSEGKIRGVEFFDPGEGIDITGLPHIEEISHFFENEGMITKQDPPTANP